MTTKFTPQPLPERAAPQAQHPAQPVHPAQEVDPSGADWDHYIPAEGQAMPVQVRSQTSRPRTPTRPVQPARPDQAEQVQTDSAPQAPQTLQPVQLNQSTQVTTQHDQLFHELMTIAGEGATGFEYLSQQDLILPRLKILQKLSPQLRQSQAQFIPGAVEGLIYNENTGDLFTEIEFLPTVFRRLILEWHGGVGSGIPPITHLTYPTSIDPADLVPAPGEEEPKIKIVEQIFMPGFLLDQGEIVQHVFISFAGTQVKKAKTIINQAKMRRCPEGVKPAMWFQSVRLGTVPEHNKKNDWHGWEIRPGTSILALPNPKTIAEKCAESVRHAAELFEAIQREHRNNEAAATSDSADDIPF